MTSSILQIERLTYRYPNGNLAIDDVSFAATAGERLGIVGPSGAGKSTLLMHLNGLLPERIESNGRSEESPAVRVSGMPMIARHLPEIRKLVGFLFQDPDDQLFCPTVREDVAFGPLNCGLSREEAAQRVEEGLAAVNLSEFAHRSTLQLSVGERKRVCLAGVFACRPSVLALDEPFSNLDPRARRQLLQILRDFTGCQLIATHDLDIVVEHCTRVIVLDQGRIRADGRPEDVLGDRSLMDRHGLEVPLRLQRAK